MDSRAEGAVEHLPPERRSSAALAARFRRFAIEECSAASDEGAGSRIYEILSETVAREPELLSMARKCRVGQPIPNFLFAAVKRVAAAYPNSELAGLYRHAGAAGQPPALPGQMFTEFALAHRDQIIDYLETRMVQTNEVGRCSYLMPGFGVVGAENPNRSLALVEVGASAGLNLNWDWYKYRYSTGDEFGPADSPVAIECDVKNGLPDLPRALPQVSFKVGIDLAPVDLGDDEEYLWMQALVWPEHREREALLSAARETWLKSRPTMLQGDAIELLPEALGEAPDDAALCVFHCHTLNQFPPEARDQFDRILSEASMSRTVYHLPAEGQRFSLRRIAEGTAKTLWSGRCQVHGRWIAQDTHTRVSHSQNQP